MLDGHASNWAKVLSGVPQGSVLGPVLFLVYINDLDAAVGPGNLLGKFADDTKVGRKITSPQDSHELQQALKRLMDWAEKWGMSFNTSKCKVMHLGHKNAKVDYRMGNQQLEVTDQERDIGVTVAACLKPSAHCLKAAKKASMVLGQITRAFQFRAKKSFVGLYKQHVRPHLEFASQAWSPWNKGDIDTLEKVQIRAVNLVVGLKGTTYDAKLEELNLPTLETRRKEADMILAHKILTGNSGFRGENWFQRADTNAHSTRAASDKTRVKVPNARLEIRRNFYTVRAATEWNSLPTTVRESRTPYQFKMAIKRHYKGGFVGGAGRQ